MRHRLTRDFFARDPVLVARELLGAILWRHDARVGTRTVQITETEAYGGRGDRASHAHRGRTTRNTVMFGPPGHAYVYFTYGMHWLLNVVCAVEEVPAAVLIRGVRLLRLVGAWDEGTGNGPRPHDLLDGPAKLTKALRITGTLNGEDLSTSRRLWITRGARIARARIHRTPRIGVDYAGTAARWKRRFVLVP